MKGYNLYGLFFLLLCFCSCNKEVIKPYSFVNVRYLENEDYIYMETVEGSMENNVAQLHGSGYNHEQFYLYLPSLKDTGNYANPTINNISFSDGLDFNANKFRDGFIHIGYIDSATVSGNFRVALDDDYNGAETRVIVGSFGINIH